MGTVIYGYFGTCMDDRAPIPTSSMSLAVARRLRAVRVALGLRPTDVCKSLGWSGSLYSNWEAARSRPNIEDMIRFADRYQVGLDWIYRADPTSLRQNIADEALRLVRQYEDETAA